MVECKLTNLSAKELRCRIQSYSSVSLSPLGSYSQLEGVSPAVNTSWRADAHKRLIKTSCCLGVPGASKSKHNEIIMNNLRRQVHRIYM